MNPSSILMRKSALKKVNAEANRYCRLRNLLRTFAVGTLALIEAIYLELAELTRCFKFGCVDVCGGH